MLDTIDLLKLYGPLSDERIDLAIKDGPGPATSLIGDRYALALEVKQLRAAQCESAKRVRSVVQNVFEVVARLTGYRFPERVVEDVATRVATELTTTTTPEP